jgi:hypothetical protein
MANFDDDQKGDCAHTTNVSFLVPCTRPSPG